MIMSANGPQIYSFFACLLLADSPSPIWRSFPLHSGTTVFISCIAFCPWNARKTWPSPSLGVRLRRYGMHSSNDSNESWEPALAATIPYNAWLRWPYYLKRWIRQSYNQHQHANLVIRTMQTLKQLSGESLVHNTSCYRTIDLRL